MLKVLYLSLFPDLTRGGQNSLLLLLKALDKERIKAGVVTPGDGNLDEAIQALGIDTFHMEWPHFRKGNPYRIGKAVLVLKKIIKDFKPDIIHTDSPRNTHLASLVKGNIKLLCHLRVSTPDGFSDRVLASETDGMIAVSKGVYERFRRYPEEVTEKIRIITNAVEVEKFRVFDEVEIKKVREEYKYSNSDKIVVFMGANDPVKRHPFFMDLWPEVVSQNNNARLILLGRDTEKIVEEFKNEISDPEVINSVKSLSYIENPQDVIPAFDLLVLPSEMEGFPRVLIEAAASGLPVIASDATGVREGVIHGKTGYAIDPIAKEKWSESILDLLGDDEKRKKYGQAGREWVVSEFSAQNHAERIMDFYDDLIMK